MREKKDNLSLDSGLQVDISSILGKDVNNAGDENATENPSNGDLLVPLNKTSHNTGNAADTESAGFPYGIDQDIDEYTFESLFYSEEDNAAYGTSFGQKKDLGGNSFDIVKEDYSVEEPGIRKDSKDGHRKNQDSQIMSFITRLSSAANIETEYSKIFNVCENAEERFLQQRDIDGISAAREAKKNLKQAYNAVIMSRNNHSVADDGNAKKKWQKTIVLALLIMPVAVFASFWANIAWDKFHKPNVAVVEEEKDKPTEKKPVSAAPKPKPKDPDPKKPVPVMNIPTKKTLPAAKKTDPAPEKKQPVATYPVRLKNNKNAVHFGHYPQGKNGEIRPIEWIVLEENSYGALLLSKYALDLHSFNDEEIPVSWNDSSIRKWLNGDFAKKAFSESETKALAVSKLSNHSVSVTLTSYDISFFSKVLNKDLSPLSGMSSSWEIRGAANTEDKIFLLSYSEAKKYLDKEKIGAGNTQYLSYKHQNHSPKLRNIKYCGWWLRTVDEKNAMIVLSGRIFTIGDKISESCDVIRPAIRVKKIVNSQ